MQNDMREFKAWVDKKYQEEQTRDKLVELIKESHEIENDVLFTSKKPLEFDEWTGIYADHLIESGVTVLPCKLYDTVYMVGRYTCQIIASTVVGIICLEKDYTLLLDNGSYLSYVHQVGETAFFDREQAEQKLREDCGYNYADKVGKC
jgi:hypothetical protein